MFSSPDFRTTDIYRKIGKKKHTTTWTLVDSRRLAFGVNHCLPDEGSRKEFRMGDFGEAFRHSLYCGWRFEAR